MGTAPVSLLLLPDNPPPSLPNSRGRWVAAVFTTAMKYTSYTRWPIAINYRSVLNAFYARHTCYSNATYRVLRLSRPMLCTSALMYPAR